MASAPPMPPARVTWKDWLPAISLAVLLLGIVMTGGSYIAQLQDNTRRIGALEADVQRRADLLNQIDVRTARIEAKLEMLSVKPDQGIRP